MLTESVIRKANQIVANLAYLGPDEVEASVAAHMRSFWPPTERAELFRLLDARDGRLEPVALAAAERLRASEVSAPDGTATPR